MEGQREAGVQHRFGRHFQLLQLCLLQSFGFCSPVLKPDLHLGLGQVEGAGELGPLGDGEVLLLPELAFEGQQL